MDAQDQVVIAQLCLSLILIWFALGYMYKRTRTDRYRETLFTLRDDLFDYVWKNELSYDLPAYRLMRAFLNGSIRVADEVTPLSFVVLMFTIAHRMPAGDRLYAAIEAIDDPRIQKHFMETRDECVRALLVFLGPIGAIVKLGYKVGRFGSWLRQQRDRWMDELVTFGSQDAQMYPRARPGLVHRWL